MCEFEMLKFAAKISETFRLISEISQKNTEISEFEKLQIC